jgi:hypothetical protein
MSKRSRCIIAVAATLYAARLDAQTKIAALDADVETTYNLPNGQQFTSHGHLYRSQNGKVRQDSGRGSMITDLNNGTVTLLIAEKKEARVISIPRERRAAPRKDRPAAAPFEEATIEGHRVVKARGKGPRGENQEIWTAKDLGIVTYSKVEAAGLTTTRALHNVAVREPDPSVFQVPADYTIVNQQLRTDGANSGRAAPASSHPLGRVIMVEPKSSPAKR